MLLRAFYLGKCPFDIQLLDLCSAWKCWIGSLREFCVLSGCSMNNSNRSFLWWLTFMFPAQGVTAQLAEVHRIIPVCIPDCLWITANKWWLLWHELVLPEKHENAPELIPGHHNLCFCVKSFIIWKHQMPESLSQESKRSEIDLINHYIMWQSLLHTQHMYFSLLLTVAWILCIAKNLNTEINLLQMLTCGWQHPSFSGLRY